MESSDSAPTRTVLGIVWGALATIIICTWTILHLNVPKQRQGRDPGWWGDIKWSSIWRYLKVSILTILAPETFLVQAASAWFIARAQLRQLHTALPATKETWGMTHMLFAQMGGFVVEYNHNTGEEKLSNSDPAGKGPDMAAALSADTTTNQSLGQSTTSTADGLTDASGGWLGEPASKADGDSLDRTLEHTTGDGEDGRTPSAQLDHEAPSNSEQPLLNIAAPDITEPGGGSSAQTAYQPHADLEDGRYDPRDELKDDQELPNIYHFTAESLRNALVQRLLPIKIPSADEILDRSKSSFFTKLLTLGQVLWFVVTFCVRWARGLPILPLELGVLSFVICAAVTYVFVLAKPKDVCTAITLKRYDALPHSIRDLRRGYVERVYASDVAVGAPISSDMGISDKALFICFGTGILIGALHLAGWNLNFPTPVDAWLWRSAAVGATAAPIVIFSIYASLDSVPGNPATLLARGLTDLLYLTFFAANILYVAARVILLVEMFRCLVHLPPGALSATWTQAVPHIG